MTHEKGMSHPKTESKSVPPLFLHITNPVVVTSSSDLYKAQPITFETMEKAKSFADLENISVKQIAAYYPEDEVLVPKSFGKCPPLEHSCLDFHTFKKKRKLPLLQDILSAAYKYEEAEYVVYTNVDIALMPHFYVSAKKIMEEGYDVVNIFRRTLNNTYESLEEIPYMYADLGEDHPGTDCFIIKRSLLEKIELQKIVIGSQFVALALRTNLHAFANKIAEFPRMHMTFHLGDDREWLNHDEYSAYNAAEVDKMFEQMLKREDITNPDILKKFYKKFQNRKESRKANKK